MKLFITSTVALALSTASALFPSYEEYILSPASRDIVPSSILSTSGNVSLSGNNTLAATLSGDNALTTFDFGRQVNGFVTLRFGASTTPGTKVGVAFTENVAYVGVKSDNSTATDVLDGTIYADAQPDGSFTFGREFARGSYRYLTLSTSDASALAEVLEVSTHFTAAPSTADDKLREYSGYFYSDDDLLNRIWYAGAYTLQLSTISANESRANPPTISNYGWFNNATITGIDVDAEVFVDGAKRDRTPWAGDYGIATPSKAVSLNADNLWSLRNAIMSLFSLQDSNGQLPYAGMPYATFFLQYGINSNIYHIWTLIALADYTQLSGDTALVASLWDKAIQGFNFILVNLDTTDFLLNIKVSSDWGRLGQTGKTIVGNTLIFHALGQYAELAKNLNVSDAAYNGTGYDEIAARIKASVNSELWDESSGMFFDNTTDAGHNLHPQDGNAHAVRFNIVDYESKAKAISAGLAGRWTEFGAVSVEGANVISPFVGGLEVDAHFIGNSGNASHALELVRRQWGYMLNAFSNSTFLEGYYHTGELVYPFLGDNAGAYISHAHAWSTGPVASLTLYLGGLRPVTGAGKLWTFEPHAAGSNVGVVNTGYTLATGDFGVEWTAKTGSKNTFFIAAIVTPAGTSGSISIPTFGHRLTSIHISINGKNVWKRGAARSNRFGQVSATEYFVTASEIQGGGAFQIVAKLAS